MQFGARIKVEASDQKEDFFSIMNFRNHLRSGGLIGALVIGVAACTSTEQPSAGPGIGSSLGTPIVAGPPPAPGTAAAQPPGNPLAPTPPPFGTPRGQQQSQAAPTIQRTSVTERTSVGPDGTIRTDRTTTSVGFNPERAAGALGAIAGGGAANNGLPGVWTMQSSSNQSMCTVYLYGGPGASEGAAASSGCPVGGIMSGITAWSFANGQMTISKGVQTAITLNQMGPNRFDGTATWGFLSTRIALYR